MLGALLDPGTVVAGRFEVVELVDSGGMGSVYRATDLLDNRRAIALKVIRDQPAPHSSLSLGPHVTRTSLDTQQLLDSFQREAELLAASACRRDAPLRHWSPERLDSDEARRAWVEPDLAPLPWVPLA